MSTDRFTLIPPGQRKGNKDYLVRWSADGRDHEATTKARDAKSARHRAREIVAEHAAQGRRPQGERMSFAEAAELYLAWRSLPPQDRHRIARLVGVLGRLPIGEIRQVDLVRAANELYPTATNQSKNRSVIIPAGAILHYAARNQLVPWLRIEHFKRPKPQSRAVSKEVAQALIAAAPAGPRQFFLLWIFRQGSRITDTLQLDWTNIDLGSQTARLFISKTQSWLEMPLHDEVFEYLCAWEGNTTGRVFPWKSREQVHRWLKPLRERLGITFTAHMARHSLGTWLNEAGAGQKTIGETLGHTDPRSSAIYTAAGLDVVRAANARIGGALFSRPNSGEIPGKPLRKPRKA